MKNYISRWDELKIGDLVECSAGGERKTLLVCEKVEADKNVKKYNPFGGTLKMAVLYAGKDRYTLFENDLSRNDVCVVWEGKVLKQRLSELEV